MRYVKRFNESNDDNFDITKALDLEYIKSCFINMIDEYDGDEDWETSSTGAQIEYEIYFLLDTNNNDIDNILKNLEESAEIIKEIKACIKKVQIEYPNIEPDIAVEQEKSKKSFWERSIKWDDFTSITCIRVLFNSDSIKN